MKSEEPIKTTKPKEKAAPTPPGDKYIWAIYITLCLISVVEQYSASSTMVTTNDIIGPLTDHLMHLFLGFLVIYFVQRIHYSKFILLVPVLAVVSVGCAIYVMIGGDVINGAKRSFRLFGMLPVQPAELIKFTSAALIALIMSKSQLQDGKGISRKGLITTLVAIAIFGGVLIRQGTTNTIILLAISFSMMIVGGVPLKKIFAIIGIGILLAGSAVGVKLLMEKAEEKDATELVAQNSDSQIEKGETVDRFSEVLVPRLKRWWYGDTIPKWQQKITRTNYQEQFSYIAQAHGGVVRFMPGNSRETSRLPLAFSDYIFAIVIEDLGLVGGVFVLILYIFLLFRAGGIASQCTRAFPAMLVIGMALYITFQALFHMGIVSGLLPVSGQPLPLISAGGTSILITSLAIGVMLSVSRFATRKGTAQKRDINQEISALPENVRAENPSQL